MRIITWNCNMAFRKKAGIVLAHKPDILVVPECEHPDKLKFDSATAKPNDILWFGSNQHKGLGIFSYSEYRFKLIKKYDPELRTIVPIQVTGGHFNFNLYAVWANNPADPDGPYVTQVWKAIQHYKRLLSKEPSILIGDFNSNTIWDRPRREGNHSTVTRFLEQRGIHSLYHAHFKQLQGTEQHPTFYLYKKKDKPYHLDYCFASESIMDKLESVEIGDHTGWMQYSDHVPVIATFRKN